MIKLFFYEIRNKKGHLFKNGTVFSDKKENFVSKGIVEKSRLLESDSIRGATLDPNEKNDALGKISSITTFPKPNNIIKKDAVEENGRSDFDKIRPITHEAEWRKMGMDCERKGRYEEAISYYKKALEENPLVYDMYDELARVYFMMGNKGASRQSFKKVIETNPYRFQSYPLFAARFMQDLARDDLAPDKEDLQFLSRYAHANSVVSDILKSIADKAKYKQEMEDWITHDIEEIIQRSHRRGIEVILQDYPGYWDTFKSVSLLLKKIAQKNSIPFVNNEQIFEQLFLKGERKDDYFAFDKAHCNAKGYDVMAQNIYDAIVTNKSIEKASIVNRAK